MDRGVTADKVIRIGPVVVGLRRRQEPICPELADALERLRDAMLQTAPGRAVRFVTEQLSRLLNACGR